MARHRGVGARVQLLDCESLATPDPAVVMRRIAAEALILQDEAEALLTGIVHGDELGVAAPRGGPLVRRFFALADALPRDCRDPRQREVRDALQTILVHHAMQVSTALDFLAVTWRSERLAEQITRLGGLGEPAVLLEAFYHELRDSA